MIVSLAIDDLAPHKTHTHIQDGYYLAPPKSHTHSQDCY